MSKVCIIYNSFSGKGKAVQLVPQIEAYLKQIGFESESYMNDYPRQLDDYRQLIIVGGDGTIQNVFNHFQTVLIPVLLIRSGTGNDFYEHVYGKSNWRQQLDKLKNPRLIKIDAGVCNQKIFLNGLGIGFDGEVVQSGLGKKWFSGKAAYMSTVLSLLFTHKETEITAEINGQVYSGPMFMLSVANGSTYGGGFKVAPNADLQDGVLEFSWVKNISLFKRMRYLPIIEKGKHLNLPFIDYLQIEKVKIKSDKLIQAHLDGEWFESKIFDVQILKSQYQLVF
ncbi:MAG: diacylglycerol/lipid kinase family protein [Bacteroidia bacterium]